MIAITLLGTGSPLPDAHRAGPSTLVSAGDAHLLIDAGRGVMMRLAAAGKLPAKFFVDVSGRVGPLGARGFGYVVRGGRQVKFWDCARHRLLPVTSFTMILPVEMRDAAPPDPWDDGEGHANPSSSPATNVQVAELADDLLVFQSETKHMLNGLVIAVVVICVLIGAINLVPLFR